MRRKLSKVALKAGTVLLGLLVVVALVLIGRAKWAVGRSYSHVPLPAISADRSPAGVARGEVLFQALCMECHGGADGRATGKRLEEVPSFLGTFYSANLAHPERGVHRRSDGELARVLRFGVLPGGKLSPVMNGFGKLGDADVAALLGYIRSGAPPFVPGGEAQPPTRLSLVGEVILTWIAGLEVDRPATGVATPAKAPTVAYGRYMAEAMDCVGCHTAGFSGDKLRHPEAFAGGFEMTDPTGAAIWSKNITRDAATGIGRWSLDDFERAVTRGVTPDGYLVRKPMPLFARLDRTDVAAIFAFLDTTPKVAHANRPGGHPLQRPRPDDPPEVLFVNVGCAACHGAAAPFRDKLAAATTKEDGDVASWILDPQVFKPGSPMPSFQGALDRPQAERLARYVKEIARRAAARPL
jgi:mono/diheme cytochrome c family protein